MAETISNGLSNQQTPSAQPAPNPVTPPTPVAPPTPPVVAPPAAEPIQPSGKKKNMIVLAILALLLIVAGGWFLWRRRPTAGTGQAPTVAQRLASTDLSKYETDADKDGYPDFVETELGFNPNESAYDACKKSSCGELDLTKTTSSHNVLLILDASGSMMTGGRMDVAKQAIRNYVTQAGSNTNIGLMIYGHKGSNSTADKPVSCASADVIAPIGQVNTTSLEGYLAGVKPVGWTPMGYALQQAAGAFAGKEGQNNEVILLSDGEETCNSNPTGQATSLKNSSAKVTINVIGFAVDAAAQTQLNQISTSGGGTFSVANNLTELDLRFKDLYENGQKALESTKCLTASADTFRTCYGSQYNKTYDWISKRKLLLYDKKITQDEYTALDDLSGKLFKQYTEITSNETNSAVNKSKEQWQNLQP